jgi:hypothetical protein
VPAILEPFDGFSWTLEQIPVEPGRAEEHPHSLEFGVRRRDREFLRLGISKPGDLRLLSPAGFVVAAE